MSDSSNSKLQEILEDEFNANKHLKSLCEGYAITVEAYAEIEYEKGWRFLIERLIKDIRQYSVTIRAMNPCFGQLEIEFLPRKTTKAALVWQAVTRARLSSSEICSHCGQPARRKAWGSDVLVMCRSCIQVAAERGETGTWLDKF